LLPAVKRNRIQRILGVLGGNLIREIADAGELGRVERFVHFWVSVGKSFARNRCPVRAAALSYSTLLAFVPLLAVVISVTSSFLTHTGEEKIYIAIDRFVAAVMPQTTLNAGGNIQPGLPNSTAADGTAAPGSAGVSVVTPSDDRVLVVQKEMEQRIRGFIHNMSNGALGGVGTLFLVFMAIWMLVGVENTFNDIWGVAHGRNWLTRVVLYWTAITLGPMLVIGALGLTSRAHWSSTKTAIEKVPLIGGAVFDLAALAVLWLTFALFYQMVPNAKVKFSAAMVGGIVAGSLWHLNNAFGFLYASRAVTNNKIYGGLGLVPVFVVGIYFSWLILLFGAQVAYAFQNRKAYLQEILAANVNERGREYIALWLVTCVGQRFARDLPPAKLQEIATDLEIPSKLVQQVLQPLLAARLLTEIAGAEPAYLPGRPLDAITAKDILSAMRAGGGIEVRLSEKAACVEIHNEFLRIEAAEGKAASAVTLTELVNRTPIQIEDSAQAEKEK
jgi:membrane protein